MEATAKIGEAQKELEGVKGKHAADKEAVAASTAKALGQLAEGRARLSEAGKMTTRAGLFDYAWQRSKKIPVRVVSGNKIEGNYSMPKESAQSIIGQKGITESWVDGGARINSETEGRGQESNDMMRQATNKMWNFSQFAQDERAQEAVQKIQDAYQQAVQNYKTAERNVSRDIALAQGQMATGDQMIQAQEFEIEEGAKARDREISGAKSLAEMQKDKQAELYRRWRDRRQNAYAAISHMNPVQGEQNNA